MFYERKSQQRRVEQSLLSRIPQFIKRLLFWKVRRLTWKLQRLRWFLRQKCGRLVSWRHQPWNGHTCGQPCRQQCIQQHLHQWKQPLEFSKLRQACWHHYIYRTANDDYCGNWKKCQLLSSQQQHKLTSHLQWATENITTTSMEAAVLTAVIAVTMETSTESHLFSTMNPLEETKLTEAVL